MLGHQKKPSRLPMIIAAIGTMAIAAAATALFSGVSPRTLPVWIGTTAKQAFTLFTVLGVLGVTMYVRHLVRKAIVGGAKRAWTAVQPSTPPTSPLGNSVGTEAASSVKPDQTGQAKAPPKMFGTIISLLLILWFLWPMWASIVRALGISKTPFVMWLPVLVFGIWAWNRHREKN